MTTLVIQTESVPLTVNLPTKVEMTTAEFYEFCQAESRPAHRAQCQRQKSSSRHLPFQTLETVNFNLALQIGKWG